ncbi:septum formation initiator family protein [Bacteroides sp. 224]|uniref:FtsB family cell division protein n=1 Tax=Bacteroides sp. 224 TaxID=2302936 RepID=UPI0013CF71D2|nr:septum formation initiator family protein [Bacteroides sp. 224]NDV66935.1 septum formation initiator family protein [Bacteroides sp. 224]
MDKLAYFGRFFVKHKYIITLAAFIVIIGFLDENSWARRAGYDQEINNLKKEIAKYRAEYEESTEKLNELTANPEALERIAREKYLMKKPNEDIYVFDN